MYLTVLSSLWPWFNSGPWQCIQKGYPTLIICAALYTGLREPERLGLQLKQWLGVEWHPLRKMLSIT